MSSDSDKYLIKLKQLGLSNESIAKKIGWEVYQVEKAWQDILKQASSLVNNGLGELQAAFDNLCLMYEALGESLKVQGFMLGNAASREEICKVLDANSSISHEDINQCLDKLMTSFIILRPFVVPTPKEQMEADVKKN